MRKFLVVVSVSVGLIVVLPASAQHVKTFGSKPNPIREYGKYRPHPGPTAYKGYGSGAHRAA